MLPGPTYIKGCPKCSCRIAEESLLSGNNFGEVVWTDGMNDAPMLPNLPQLVLCPDCSTFLWLADLDQVDSPKSFGRLEGAKWPIIPTFSDYVDYLSSNKLKPERERHARILAWWAGNHPRRRGGPKKHRPSLTEQEIWNLECLDQMLDPSVENERIMKAEIKRELSDFNASLSFLSQPSRTRTEQVIEELCKKCDPLVVDLTSYQTTLEKQKYAIDMQEMGERLEQKEKNAGYKLAGVLFICLLLAILLSFYG